LIARPDGRAVAGSGATNGLRLRHTKMKAEIEFLHCGEQLQKVVADEISEIASVVDAVKWSEVFEHSENDTVSQHQTAYNKALARNFRGLGWETFPVLRRDPKLIGDFRKGMVFVEIQFGNSATLYRDFYKFQYGLRNGLLSLAVLIVPMKAAAFFPTRLESVRNMAEFALARSYFTVLEINVPTMLIGLQPTD
jgi:hypothetical protein